METLRNNVNSDLLNSEESSIVLEISREEYIVA
jgi:hypothetical protein